MLRWWPALIFTALAGAAVFETGPLAFLPPVLRYPLLLAIGFFWLQAHQSRVRTWAAQFEAGPTPLEWSAVAFITLTWLLLKLVGIHAASTDDNIYFYLANRMTEGAVPYRDFFFAHPPVHLLVPAVLFKLFGWSIALGRSIPVLAHTLTGLFIWSALRRTDRLVALLCLLLQFTAYEVLESSSDMNGQDLLCLGLSVAFWFASRGRPVAAGIAAGLGLGSALYGTAVVLAVGLGFLVQQRRAALQFFAGVIGSFTAVCLPFIIWSGQTFFDCVFRYHTLKPPSGNSERLSLFATSGPLEFVRAFFSNTSLWFSSKDWLKVLHFHAPLFIAAALGALCLAMWKVQQPKRGAETPSAPSTPWSLQLHVFTALLAVVLGLLQYSGFNRVYSFYTVPLITFLSVPAAFAVSLFIRSIARAITSRTATLTGASLALFALHVPLSDSLIADLWPDEVKDRGAVVNFGWKGLQFGQPFSELVKTLFFVDHRIKGRTTLPWQHFLWHKQQRFSAVTEMAQWVEQHSTPAETLIGASGFAPLIALESHRRLAADEADTNSMRFQSGLFTAGQLWRRACADNVRYVVSAPRSYFDAAGLNRMNTVRTQFALERSFDDRELLFSGPVHLELWRRADAACESKD